MRNILKISMIAGAALTVAACGGETSSNNTAVTDLGNDTMLDANMTDMGDMNATDMNATDANATDANAADANATDTNAQ